jgi:hypothetical protein
MTLKIKRPAEDSQQELLQHRKHEGLCIHEKSLNENVIKNKKFWEELVTYFPWVQHTPHKTWCVQQFLYCCMCITAMVTCLPSHCLSVMGRYTRVHTHTHRLSFDTTQTTQKMTRPKILLLFVSIHCRRTVFTELLSSNDGGMHTDTHTDNKVTT